MGPTLSLYDSDKKLVFSSNGEDGTLTVVKQESADKYSVAATYPPKRVGVLSRLDQKTGKIYIAAAKFGPPPAATANDPHPRRSVTSGSFHLVVVSPE